MRKRMSRCACCSVKMDEHELTRKNKYGEYETMCSSCLEISLDEDMPEHKYKEYQHEQLTNGRARFFQCPRG